MKMLIVLWMLAYPFYTFANTCELLPNADTGEAIGENNYIKFDAVKNKGDKLELIFYTQCKDDQANNHTVAEKWLATYLSVCDQDVIKKNNATIDTLEQADDWSRAKIKTYEVKNACYNAIVKGLELEKAARQAGLKSYQKRNDAKQNSEKDTAEVALKIKEAYNNKQVEINSDISGLAAAVTGLDGKITSLNTRFSNDDDTILKRLQNDAKLKEKIANIISDNNYTAVFYLGMNMMPEYNDLGENEGFSETDFLGRLELDLRGDLREPKKRQKVKPFYVDLSGTYLPSYHAGITLEFASESVVDCEKSNEPKPDAEKVDCEKSLNKIDSLKFNDISHTVNASVYALLNLWQSEASGAEFGVVGRVGLQSRDKLKENGDSINKFHYVGLRWSGYDVYWNDAEHKGKNRLPLFYIEFSKAKFEDYAGLGKRDRIIWKSGYRPFDSKPFYIGLNVNGGKGPDEIALQVTYGFQAQRLFDIL